jgi:hypothetical protein
MCWRGENHHTDRGRYSGTTPIIVISGRGDAVKLKQLLSQGLDDYIYKPFKSEELLEKVQTSLAKRQPPKENRRELGDAEIVGGPAIMDLMLKVERRAKSQLDTLILGENGTGKDLFAKLYLSSSAPGGRSTISTVRRSPPRFSRRRSSAGKKALTPALSSRKARSRKPRAASLFSTRSANWTLASRPNCCTSLIPTKKLFAGWAGTRRSSWT